MDFNELIDKTHFDYEQNETQAKQLEERILKVPGMSKSYLPKRKYGENYKGDQLGMTAQSLIVNWVVTITRNKVNGWSSRRKRSKNELSEIEFFIRIKGFVYT